MTLVAQGNTSRQICRTLFISPRTVEMHVQGSLLKLGCRTRAEAVRRLAELGTLPPGTQTQTLPPAGHNRAPATAAPGAAETPTTSAPPPPSTSGGSSQPGAGDGS